MRLFIFLFAFLFSFPTLAQDDLLLEPNRIEVDQDSSVVRVIIDGRPVAQFTSSGLMVVGDIEYGDQMRDRGSEAISDAIESVTGGEGDAP